MVLLVFLLFVGNLRISRLCLTCKTSPTGSGALPLAQSFMEFWKLLSTIDIQTFANENLPLELVSQLIDKVNTLDILVNFSQANFLHSIDNVILCKLRLDLAVAIADTPQDFDHSKRLNLAARLLAGKNGDIRIFVICLYIAACITMDRYSCFKVTRIYWYMRLVQWHHTLANNEAKA